MSIKEHDFQLLAAPKTRTRNLSDRNHDLRSISQEQIVRSKREQDRIDYERAKEKAKDDPKWLPVVRYFEGRRERIREHRRRLLRSLNKLMDGHGYTHDDIQDVIGGYVSKGTIRSILRGEAGLFSRTTIRLLGKMLSDELKKNQR